MAARRNAKVCFIYAVHYDEEKRHITKVKAQISTGGPWEPMQILTKSKVVEKVDADWIVMTSIKKDNGELAHADVIAPTIKGKRYIKTVPNEIEEDNLGELPTF